MTSTPRNKAESDVDADPANSPGKDPDAAHVGMKTDDESGDSGETGAERRAANN